MSDTSSFSDIAVRIVLPEDTVAQPATPPVVRYGGEALSGNAEVVTKGNFWFEIVLSLEG